MAAGVALAAKLEGSGQVVCYFFGDGAVGEGAVHAAMLMAANWKLPMIFICSNNGMGMFVPVEEAQFCRQCGQCRPGCPQGADIPRLMRAHMYAAQYSQHWLAAETLAAIEPGRGLTACASCESCAAKCTRSVNIARKIQYLKALLSPTGVLLG